MFINTTINSSHAHTSPVTHSNAPLADVHRPISTRQPSLRPHKAAHLHTRCKSVQTTAADNSFEASTLSPNTHVSAPRDRVAASSTHAPASRAAHCAKQERAPCERSARPSIVPAHTALASTACTSRLPFTRRTCTQIERTRVHSGQHVHPFPRVVVPSTNQSRRHTLLFSLCCNTHVPTISFLTRTPATVHHRFALSVLLRHSHSPVDPPSFS
jgi:hypothetical protein